MLDLLELCKHLCNQSFAIKRKQAVHYPILQLLYKMNLHLLIVD